MAAMIWIYTYAHTHTTTPMVHSVTHFLNHFCHLFHKLQSIKNWHYASQVGVQPRIKDMSLTIVKKIAIIVQLT